MATNVQEHLGELLEVVHEADQAIMGFYESQDFKTEIKADDTPVTEADIAAHNILMAGISRLFLDIPILSEEGDTDLNREIVQTERFWLVDPLDGTREFIARSGHFTVCAALIENDVPSFGIISAPALGVTYYGGESMGSFRKEAKSGDVTPIHVSSDPVGAVVGSRMFLDAQTTAYIEEHYPGSEILSVGSQLKLPKVAEGVADAYPRIGGPLHLWDLAAGHAILTGAGGTVTRPNGDPIDYHTQTLKAGDFVARS